MDCFSIYFFFTIFFINDSFWFCYFILAKFFVSAIWLSTSKHFFLLPHVRMQTHTCALTQNTEHMHAHAGTHARRCRNTCMHMQAHTIALAGTHDRTCMHTIALACTHAHMHAHTHSHVGTHALTCRHTCAHMQAHMRSHAGTHALTCRHTCAHMQAHMRSHAGTHTCTSTLLTVVCDLINPDNFKFVLVCVSYCMYVFLIWTRNVIYINFSESYYKCLMLSVIDF